MRFSAFRNVVHHTQPTSRTRLAAFWLGFAVLLVLSTLAFAMSVRRSWAEGAQHVGPGAPRQQGDGLSGVVAEEATSVPATTSEASAVNEPVNTTLPPQNTVVPDNGVESLGPGNPQITPQVEAPANTPEPVPEVPTAVGGGGVETPITSPSDPTAVTTEPIITVPPDPVLPSATSAPPPIDPAPTGTPPIDIEPPTATTAPDLPTEPVAPPTDVTDVPGPGVTNTPETIDPPGITNTPVVIDGPAITVTPDRIDPPGITNTPVVIDGPAITVTPDRIDLPDITDTPANTVTPHVTNTPDDTRTPFPPFPTIAVLITPTAEPVSPSPTSFLLPIFFTPQPPRGTSTPRPTEPITSSGDVIIVVTIQPTATVAILPTTTSSVVPLITFTPLATHTPNFVPTSALIPSATLVAHATIVAIGSTATAASDTARNPASSPIEVATAFSDRATAVSALATVMPANTPYVDPSLPVFERAVTATLAVDAGAPILVYTYTQKINANGEHIIAACIWNLGTAAATDIDVQFNAHAPAIFTAVRIPSEQSELDDRQVKVRIASLTPKMLKQIEVVVMRVDAPLPQWVSVGIPQAYALDHAGDPAAPDACTSTGIDSVASISREVEIAVGGRYDLVNDQIEAVQQRDEDPQLMSVALTDQGPPAFSSFVLYCVIGLILATLLVVTLLSSERSRRKKPSRRRQRISS